MKSRCANFVGNVFWRGVGRRVKLANHYLFHPSINAATRAWPALWSEFPNVVQKLWCIIRFWEYALDAKSEETVETLIKIFLTIPIRISRSGRTELLTLILTSRNRPKSFYQCCVCFFIMKDQNFSGFLSFAQGWCLLTFLWYCSMKGYLYQCPKSNCLLRLP